MADLTGKAFQRDKTEEFNRKAVQQNYRSPDKFAGDVAFGEADVWKAVESGMGTVAKVFGVLENNRQQAIVDDIEQKIQTKFLEDDELIQGTANDISPTDLDAKTIMTEYHADGYKMPNGKTLGVMPITDYEKYEDLSFKHKRKIDKFYQTSKETTQANLAKQLDKLSSTHTLASLDRLSLNVHQESSRILSNPKSWNEAKEMAPYLKTFLKDAGSEYDPGMRREAYKKYIINQVREGYADIPGAGPLGSRPEDVGVKVGLTKEANKKMDIALERLSTRVFDAVKNTGVNMEDADKIISQNMQLTLLQQFLNHSNLNEAGAIAKAKDKGYRYTREYDGQGGLGTIEYILKPSTLRPYIDAYNKRDKSPKQDLVKYAKIENNLKARNPNSYDITEMTRTLERNPDITPPYLAKLIAIMGDGERTQEGINEASDGENIVEQIERIMITNPDFIEKLGKRNSKGKFIPHNIEQILDLIPDREDVNIEWVAPEGIYKEGHKYEGEPILEGKMVTSVNTVKGRDRDGIGYMRKKGKNKIHDLFLRSEVNSQNEQQKQIEALDKEQLTDQLSILQMLDQYTVLGGTTIDHAKVKKLWNDEKHIQEAFGGNELKFQNYASGMVYTGLNHKLFDPKIASRLVAGSDTNTEALDKAISKKQTYDLRDYLHRGTGANLPYKKLANPVDMLLAQMREQPGQAGAIWNKDQQLRIDLYENAHNTLLMVGTHYKQWDVNQLKAQHMLIKNKVPGKTVQYWRNDQFAQHIQKELEIRMIELNDSILGGAVLLKEIREGSYWPKKYSGAYVGSDEKQKENHLLKFLSSELGGKNALGIEIDYLGHQKQNMEAKDLLELRSGEAKLKHDKLTIELERSKQTLNKALLDQPQVTTRND